MIRNTTKPLTSERDLRANMGVLPHIRHFQSIVTPVARICCKNWAAQSFSHVQFSHHCADVGKILPAWPICSVQMYQFLLKLPSEGNIINFMALMAREGAN